MVTGKEEEQHSGRMNKAKEMGLLRAMGKELSRRCGGNSHCFQHKSLRSNQSRIHWTSRVVAKAWVTATATAIGSASETERWRWTETKMKDKDWEHPC